MAVYTPLFVYLTPASIPQVVAHIQKYLADNPIVSDPEAIAEVIQQYIEEHPEIISVASVNGKTGNVVLTGSDININASSAVSVETQLLNLASMISAAGSNISQIEANISQIYTTIGTLQTNVETNASNISSLQTSVEGQGTRLATAESDIDSLESAQTEQGTRLNTAEGNINSLQTRMAQAESDIDSNETEISNLNTAVNTRLNNLESLIIKHFSQNVTIAGGSASTPQLTQIQLNFPDISGYEVKNICGFVLYKSTAGVDPMPYITGGGSSITYSCISAINLQTKIVDIRSTTSAWADYYFGYDVIYQKV